MLLKYLTGATDLALNFRATYVYTVCTYNKTERSIRSLNYDPSNLISYFISATNFIGSITNFLDKEAKKFFHLLFTEIFLY